jgi:hypothetical protein
LREFQEAAPLTNLGAAHDSQFSRLIGVSGLGVGKPSRGWPLHAAELLRKALKTCNEGAGPLVGASLSAQCAAKLFYTGHCMMENRNGLAVPDMITQANGTLRGKQRQRCPKSKLRKPVTASQAGGQYL